MSTMGESPVVDGSVGMSSAELAAKLDQLKASATKEYSLKNYNAAAEFYSEAAELQDMINGEMSNNNADLLYLYGRCLYHVAVSNSDVLGGKVASAEEPKRKKRKVLPESSAIPAESSTGSSGLIAGAISDGQQRMAEDVVEAVVEEKDGTQPSQHAGSTPYFQISGDDNFTDSEGEDGEDEADPLEEEDDFATAYEILDMARVLLARKLEVSQVTTDGKGKGNSTGDTPEARQLKERLADTHDLQAEISLENERFQDAINDTRESLTLKVQIYPEESSLVAEAHFKLSLALEFASVTSTSEGPDGESKVAQVDEEMRKEAAVEMEKAIASCKLRISKEEAAVNNLSGIAAMDLHKSIADVKEMVSDMEQRLIDLHKDPVSLSALQPAGAPGLDDDPLRGVLGALLGENKADAQKRIQEATAQANDLSGLVKHKKKPKGEPAGVELPSEPVKGKRKADDDDTTVGVVNGNGKKVKFEEPAEEI